MSSADLVCFRCFYGTWKRKLCGISILVVVMVVFFSPVARGGEKEALAALEKVKTAVKEEASYEELATLLAEAKVEVDALKRGEIDNCFLDAVKSCYYWYHLGVNSLETLMKNQEQREKFAQQAEYGGPVLKITGAKMTESYDILVKRAQEALPSKWERGNAQLDKAGECLKEIGTKARLLREIRNESEAK